MFGGWSGSGEWAGCHEFLPGRVNGEVEAFQGASAKEDQVARFGKDVPASSGTPETTASSVNFAIKISRSPVRE